MIHPTAKIGQNVIIKEGTIIGENVIIEDNVYIDYQCIIRDNVHIKRDSFIGARSILGEYLMDFYEERSKKYHPLVIGERALIRTENVIYGDTIIGNGIHTGHKVTIREGSQIGDNCSIGTLCDIQGNLRIGNHVRIHSNVFVGQKAHIEDYVWIYPHVVLTNDPYPPMGRLKGVTIREYAQVAAASVIMPGVEIGKNALIGASTLVRKNVPPERVVVGVPGKDLCSVTDLRDENGEQIYPWKNYLKDFRGYPWQDKC